MELVYSSKYFTRGLAVDLNDVLFVGGRETLSLDEEGKFMIIGNLERVDSQLPISNIRSLAFDKNNELHLSAGYDGEIFKMTKEKKASLLFKAPEDEPSSPTGICFDDKENLYFCDYDSDCISKVSSGKAIFYGRKNSEGIGAEFNGPCGMIFDKSKPIFYVTDYWNKKIKTMTLDGTVSTLCTCHANPVAIAVDGVGNLFFSTVKENHNSYKTPKIAITCFNSKGETKMLIEDIEHHVTDLAFNSKGDLYALSRDKLFVIRKEIIPSLQSQTKMR